MSTSPASKPKKKRRLATYLQNIKDSYTISRRTYPWVGWAMLGAVAAVLALAVLLTFLTSMSLWYWLFLGVLVAPVAALVILSWTVRRASYTQIEGVPGAAKAVLDQIKRGWYIEEQPAAVNPKTQDVTWRAIGRPGVVLIVEGPAGRTQKMVTDERKKVTRVLPTVPLHVINVGTAPGQVQLIDLERTMRRLGTGPSRLTRLRRTLVYVVRHRRRPERTPRPTRLTDAEITQVSNRLSSLSAKGLPVPKGVDPARVRPNRRALRGR